MTTLTSTSTSSENGSTHDTAIRAQIEPLAELLRDAFGVEFFVFHGDDGRLLRHGAEQPAGEISFRSELARAVANRSEPAFLAEEDPALVLALPVPLGEADVVVAVATFVTRHVDADEDLANAAQMLGVAEYKARRWINQQETWNGRQLNVMGRSLLEKLAARREASRLRTEVDQVSDNLANTYEEICVLYGVTQNLRLSSSDEDLGRLALDWLREVIPAEGLAIAYLPTAKSNDISPEAQTISRWLTSGEQPLNREQFAQLRQGLNLDAQGKPVVLNEQNTSNNSWGYPQVRQLIVVPLAQADNVYGWLAAFNHIGGAEFGTIEASLMGSVGAILGIHSGNVDLYRKQSDFLAQTVRALTSAIDAKDPYTCGHSDRVARLSVRLAQELRCDVATLNNLYMGGLLHDIGKIGISDSVLRKTGKLTDAEFEHIKLHPELGYNILRDIQQLEEALPVVLHHHESWDGSGYPHGLAGEDIPFLARICAVADAFDAMSSDRPYRKGLPDEKVDQIFRQGAGSQWDAQVIEAFFIARDDIREIARHERANLTIDVELWS